ncbi:MAG: DUF6691 family protein [Bacillota bacterium]
MNKKFGFLGFGILFGFALSRSGASKFDLIMGMFVGENFTLVGVIGTAIVVGLIGMQVLKRTKGVVKSGEPLKISEKKLGPWSLLGAAVFGIGWGISGACPGTVLAQLGEGKIYGFFTFAGMVLGTYIYARLKEKRADL